VARSEDQTPLAATEDADLLARVRAHTPARILAGRAGLAYRTPTQLELREDHGAALDAVRAELDLHGGLGLDLVERFGLFEVTTACGDKAEYLMRPDRGRRLAAEACAELRRRCKGGSDLQVVIGDGLSAAAVVAQVPLLLEPLATGAAERGWSFGQPFVVRHCRVGILNEIGELLDPVVAVLLIGERPGLRTAESLSAYMAYRPKPGHTDAQRNLICNIHAQGVPPAAAVERILALAATMRRLQTSGISVKERFR
jgi:ethanolamine ammonia-lyase small subunit